MIHAESIFDFLKTQSVQVAVVFVIVSLLSWLLRRHSAHIRYLLWLVVLVKCVTPPLVTFSLPILPQNPTVAVSLVESPVIAEMPARIEQPRYYNTTMTPVVDQTPTPVVIENHPSRIDNPPMSRQHLSQSEAFLIVLAAGAALYLCWAMVKALLLQCALIRRSKPLPASVAEQVKQLGLLWDRDEDFQIRLMDDIGQPFVWGWWRGIIYLPATFETLLPQKQKSILMHEMAHVIRLDPFFNLVQIVIQGLFWFHPLVWLANRAIRQEREKCCDEAAIVRLNTHPKDYGSAIVDVLLTQHQGKIPAPTLAVAGPVKNIEDRVKTIMQPGKRFFRRPSGIALLTIGLLAALVVPTTIALTQKVTPPDYTLSGKVIDPNNNPIAGAIVYDDGYGPKPYQKGVTDTEGKFEYKSWNEEHNITAKADGYLPQTITFTTWPIDNSKQLNFTLQPGQEKYNTSNALNSPAFKKRFFITIVVDKNNEIAGDGQKITLEQLDAMLSKCASPENTVLEVAFEPGAFADIHTRYKDNPVFLHGGQLVQKYKLEYLSYVGEDHPESRRSPVSIRTEDAFVTNKIIPVGMPAVELNADRPFLTVNSIQFSTTDSCFVADLKMSVISFPQRLWEIKLRLLDKDDKQLESVMNYYQNSKSNAFISDQTLRFDFGKEDLLRAAKFEIEVRLVTPNAQRLDLYLVRQIAVACIEYAGKNSGRLPETLEQIQSYLETEILLPLNQMEFLQAGRKLSEIKDVAKTALLRMPLNGGKDGAIVAYCDGHAEYFSPERMKTQEYPNVSLKPGQKTDVIIETIKPNLQFTAVLSNGVTVELLGLCEQLGKDKSWWKPDGTSLAVPAYKAKIETEPMKAIPTQYTVLVRAAGGNNLALHMKMYEGTGYSTPFSEDGTALCLVKHPEPDKAYHKDAFERGPVMVGIAQGEWIKARGEISPDMSSLPSSFLIGANDQVVIQPPQQNKPDPGITTFWATATSCDYQLKLVCTLKEGHTQESMKAFYDTVGTIETGGLKNSQIQTIGFSFDNLAADQIAGYELYYRPYEYARFENVAFKPGVKTDSIPAPQALEQIREEKQVRLRMEQLAKALLDYAQAHDRNFPQQLSYLSNAVPEDLSAWARNNVLYAGNGIYSNKWGCGVIACEKKMDTDNPVQGGYCILNNGGVSCPDETQAKELLLEIKSRTGTIDWTGPGLDEQAAAWEQNNDNAYRLMNAEKARTATAVAGPVLVMEKYIKQWPDMPQMMEALNVLGCEYNRLGRADKARETFNRAIELARTANTPFINTLQINLAQVEIDTGRYEQARQRIETVMALPVPDSLEDAAAANAQLFIAPQALAQLYMAQGKEQQANELLKENAIKAVQLAKENPAISWIPSYAVEAYRKRINWVLEKSAINFPAAYALVDELEQAMPGYQSLFPHENLRNQIQQFEKNTSAKETKRM